MPRIKLTKRAVDRLQAPDPSGKQELHWDTELKGFAVLCSGVTNAKTYIAQRDLPDGRTRRVTVAAVKELDLEEARGAAAGVLLDLRRGIDPKARPRGAATLDETLEGYLAARKNLSEKSRTDYRAAVSGHLTAWLDLPLRGITPGMVEERHRGIAKEVAAGGRYTGHATANGVMRVFGVLWNHAAERAPDLPTNPVRRLRRQWFPVERRVRHVAAKDLPAFYQAVTALPNPVHRDYLLLLLFTGLRRREAARLKWDDVDFEHTVIRLPAASTKAKRKLDLPMTGIVHDMLEARGAAGKDMFVFPSNSKSGHLEEPKFPLRQVAEATGIQVSRTISDALT